MDAPEVRLSPDGKMLAVKHDYGWTVTYTSVGARFNDADVSSWTPLGPASIAARVRCPWCEVDGRALTKTGRIHAHSDPLYFPPRRCKGSGRLPSEFKAGES